MTEIIISRIRERGRNEKTAAGVLLTIADGNNAYEEYLQLVGDQGSQAPAENTDRG